MVDLGVNVDHVATLRQARGVHYPDPVAAALLAVSAGAAHITAHLREDRRHVNERDIARLIASIGSPLNLEISKSPEIVRIALDLAPERVTIVPERRMELTTEGGLQVTRSPAALSRLIARFERASIEVTLFVDPDPKRLKAAVDVGAKAVEFNTGAYSEARSAKESAREISRLERAVARAVKLGLGVRAGHGLTLENVAPIARIEPIEEFNIGHSIVARSLIVGFAEATREMIEAIRVARG